ncbi:MAG: hypothetical protein ACRDMV_19725 [Streptosporangiales bacterium]
MHWQVLHEYSTARQAQLRAEAAEYRLARVARAGRSARTRRHRNAGRRVESAATRAASPGTSVG